MAVTPDAATSMTEVRAGVDAVDARLVALIAERMRWMDAAARIKPERGLVRDETRKAQVLGNVRALAVAEGLEPAVAEALWEVLVEASIAYELRVWDGLRGPAGGEAAESGLGSKEVRLRA